MGACHIESTVDLGTRVEMVSLNIWKKRIQHQLPIINQ
jgi:hypothetical protein